MTIRVETFVVSVTDKYAAYELTKKTQDTINNKIMLLGKWTCTDIQIIPLEWEKNTLATVRTVCKVMVLLTLIRK